jgi:hypothetical protein
MDIGVHKLDQSCNVITWMRMGLLSNSTVLVHRLVDAPEDCADRRAAE